MAFPNPCLGPLEIDEGAATVEHIGHEHLHPAGDALAPS